MVGGLPVDVGRYEIDVVRVFGEAAPRVHHVAKVVRADYVAADTPSVRIAAVDHLLHTEADLVERRHVPARMVESRPVRFREREHVMVARMRTVHERDEFA